MDIAQALRLKVCSDPTAVYAQVNCATLLEAAVEIERLRDRVTVLLGERDALHGELIASTINHSK